MKILKTLITNEGQDQDIHAGEAYSLWTQLIARYDTAELIDIFINLTKDNDLKRLLKNGLNKTILPQIDRLEKAMQRYQVPLPPRQPKGTDFSVNMDIARDQGMFRIILSMTQTALSLHTKAINICTNNFLRNMFTDFLNEEIEIYNLLLEYGESKNWVYSAPNYSNSST
ncbi:DUF3231 family protein [Pelotomaculum sp. PtaB.Bin117]|uniref:DUF3231 family protein n=1 Tax=Pelotomaculum sp. PtaB.Bin117 TaxID=1811694 RepID=UPI0009D122F4|nr:DUF3231 family protein [Pelotomaculum sp. PtaB.Bin117]OPX85807.1 MAG: hypothetical protein A4E54_02227 [Pelotomaculum sp. PtaB.Bin117]OPY63958.1 MAG: hypothetical protein A4E56_00006 [Pelotomaculum sp. PtaU1.Bin065]